MKNPWKSLSLCGVVFTAVLLPTRAETQTIAQSFTELQALVKAGDLVVVTDESGRETKVKIADVSPSSLRVFTRETTRDDFGAHRTWTAKKAFDEAMVRRIRRTDSALNGGLVGLAVGTAAAVVWLIGPCASGSDAYLRVCVSPPVAMVVGSTIAGFAIDKANGNQLVYSAGFANRPAVVSALQRSSNARASGLSFSVRF